MKYFFLTTQNTIPTGTTTQHLLISTQELFFGSNRIDELAKQGIRDSGIPIQDIGLTCILFFKEITRAEFNYYQEN